MKFQIVALALVAILTAGCGCPGHRATPANSETGLQAEDVLGEMGQYEQMTPKATAMDSFSFFACRLPPISILRNAQHTRGPHAGTTFTVSMNPSAAEVFRAGGTGYPPGAVVVKSKRGTGLYCKEDGSEFRVSDGIGGMIKRESGYDPDNGDWEYFYAETEDGAPSETQSTSASPLTISVGRLANCIDCHANAADRDYVFGTWDKEPPIKR